MSNSILKNAKLDKKVHLKLIKNTCEFISEHDVVLKILGSIW